MKFHSPDRYYFTKASKKHLVWSYYRLAGIILEFIILFLIIAEMVFETMAYDDPSRIWFHTLHFFTQQSNLIVVVFVILYSLNSQLKIFKHNNFLIATTGYITITCIVFNLILVPIGLITNQYSSEIKYPLGLFDALMYHVVNPIYMIVYFTLAVKYYQFDTNYQKKWYRTVLVALIYPICYLAYATILPFVYPLSVYGTLTNLNPNFIIMVHNEPVPGDPLNAFLFVFVILLFFIFLFVYWNIIKEKVTKHSIFKQRGNKFHNTYKQ